MIEIYTTDIPNDKIANCILSNLKIRFPNLRFSYDIEKPIINYPCTHSILRVEGEIFNTEKVMLYIHKLGFRCDVLEDKLCKY